MKFKKIVSLFLCVVFLVSLTACGTTNNEDANGTIIEGKQEEYETFFKEGNLKIGNDINVESAFGKIRIVNAPDKTVYLNIFIEKESVDLKAFGDINTKEMYFYQGTSSEGEWKKYTQEESEDVTNSVSDTINVNDILKDIVKVEYKGTNDNKDTVILSCKKPQDGMNVDISEYENAKKYIVTFTLNDENYKVEYTTWETDTGSGCTDNVLEGSDDFSLLDYDVDIKAQTLTHIETGEVINATITEKSESDATDTVEKEIVVDSESKEILSIVDKTSTDNIITYTFANVDTAKNICEIPDTVPDATEDDFMGFAFSLVAGMITTLSGESGF